MSISSVVGLKIIMQGHGMYINDVRIEFLNPTFGAPTAHALFMSANVQAREPAPAGTRNETRALCTRTQRAQLGAEPHVLHGKIKIICRREMEHCDTNSRICTRSCQKSQIFGKQK